MSLSLLLSNFEEINIEPNSPINTEAHNYFIFIHESDSSESILNCLKKHSNRFASYSFRIFLVENFQKIIHYIQSESNDRDKQLPFIAISHSDIIPTDSLNPSNSVKIQNVFESEKTNIGYQRHISDQELLYKADEYNHLSLGDLKSDLQDAEVFLRDKNYITLDLDICKQLEIPENSNADICGIFAEEFCQLAKFAGTASNPKLINLGGYDPTNISNDEVRLIIHSLWYLLEGLTDQLSEIPSLGKMKEIIVSLNGNDHDITFFNSPVTNRYWIQIDKDKNPTPCSEKEYILTTKNDLPERFLYL